MSQNLASNNQIFASALIVRQVARIFTEIIKNGLAENAKPLKVKVEVASRLLVTF